MKLVDPTDFEILEVLRESGRNTAQNVALVLDKNRKYINTRLPVLTSFGLVERIGPAENSGLYEITDRGRAVLEHRDAYGETDRDFGEYIDDELEG
jgi:predicted ArsR family transcriptional regulator